MSLSTGSGRNGKEHQPGTCGVTDMRTSEELLILVGMIVMMVFAVSCYEEAHHVSETHGITE